MTRAEMHTEFKLLMDKSGEGGSPSFLASEIDSFLNIAQEKFISKRAFGNNPRRTSFEENQKRRDDLRNLISNEAITSFVTDLTASKPNGVFALLPNDYRHSINEEATIYTGDNSTATRRVSVKPITHDRYNKSINDPFNKPDKDTVYRLDFGLLATDEVVETEEGEETNSVTNSYFELICGDGQTVSSYILRYIKTPTKIAQNSACILATHTHKELVKMAVVDALENVEQPRYQSSKIELNEIE